MSQEVKPSGDLEFEAPILELEKKIEELEVFAETTQMDLSGQIRDLLQKLDEEKRRVYAGLSPWQRVQIARHPNRPLTSDYLNMIVEDFMELYGDRLFSDDRAIVCGFGKISGMKMLIVGHRKGKGTKEKVECNFGSAHPEGYRKALDKMRIAAKFGLPIFCIIDTPGAYPGVGAEERGQAQAIARNLMEMTRFRTPIVCLVIGEGGSGGALGIGVGDRTLMLENAYYSVISPEGCAAILWKTGDKAPEAADVLRLTARDLDEFGVVDDIIAEPLGGAHRDHVKTAEAVREAVVRHFTELSAMSLDHLVSERYLKHRAVGQYLEHSKEVKTRSKARVAKRAPAKKARAS
ncbi:MAG: acetyl-CoA carboxylase carboxyltransferase subunit alpha [Planctomycetota bacterium]|nr:acetyl-CoA carboxylase carboxyltransferase subunit alpha [Planctomycetota bacterium]